MEKKREDDELIQYRNNYELHNKHAGQERKKTHKEVARQEEILGRTQKFIKKTETRKKHF